MPDLMERMYCSEQIHIPPTFPYIMKLYCKAAIRTQPYDLLKWSAAYFRALANGETPPAKERIEYPPYDTPTGLTPGYLKVLIKQIGKDPKTNMDAKTLFIKWNGVCLNELVLIKLLALLGSRTTFNWLQFVAVAAGSISGTLTQTMILICELLTEEPEGGMSTIPLDIFTDLYMYLAEMNCSPLTTEEIEEMEGIEPEEEITVIAEKIRSGFFGEEYGEDVVLGPEGLQLKSMDAKGTQKVEEVAEPTGEEAVGDVETERVVETVEEKVEETTGEEAAAEAAEEQEPEPVASKESLFSSSPSSDVSSIRSGQDTLSDIRGKSGDTEMETRKTTDPVLDDAKEKVIEEVEEEELLKAEEEIEQFVEERHRINLDALDENIRQQVEEKLAGDDDETETEDDFDNVGSNLLGASSRAKRYTPNQMGFKIFKKYVRQEISGIGPVIEKPQIEKVVDFMDYWSHKQEGMVMPRNIRHWMCPPLDYVPVASL